MVMDRAVVVVRVGAGGRMGRHVIVRVYRAVMVVRMGRPLVGRMDRAVVIVRVGAGGRMGRHMVARVGCGLSGFGTALAPGGWCTVSALELIQLILQLLGPAPQTVGGRGGRDSESGRCI